ncbi:hypothetical protein PSI23_19820 [Xenorhabdus sp. XENO-10]|uniref:Uncharacterized protein n=1 Tax=Xenorhabdus yunnanensis TaxID=3025878 RepID=A0ABT5LK26_9GAMM|nr:hypothetical protein [Xenorhabdus yunnanensis]MDC9591467.1 hypothetical protein [Xenorhabdus yunnanensis]
MTPLIILLSMPLSEDAEDAKWHIVISKLAKVAQSSRRIDQKCIDKDV